MMGIARIAPLENHFDAAEHLSGAPGIDDFAAGNLHLDTEVAFNACDWINYNSLGHMISFPS